MSDPDDGLRQALEPTEQSISRVLAGAAERARRPGGPRRRRWLAALAGAGALGLLFWVVTLRGPEEPPGVGASGYSMVSVGELVRVTDPDGATWLLHGGSAGKTTGSIVIMTGGD